MTNQKIQFVGSPCGQHGNYTFYKAFKYTIHGKQKILALGEFFLLKFWEEEDIISIGEPQLIWEDKIAGQYLISLRIYFLPENTPEGRTDEHGKDEVVALSEKVVLRSDDLINVIRAASGVKWDAGLRGVFGPKPVNAEESSQKPAPSPFYESPASLHFDVAEVFKEKLLIGDMPETSIAHVIVLNYDEYCRMRALLKRLEGVESETMKTKLVRALGGFLVPSKKTRLLFCRDVFEYPELEGHELLCNHLAPKLQGRPRKKKGRRPDSESEESSEASEEHARPAPIVKPKSSTLLPKPTTLIPGLTPKINQHKITSSHFSSGASSSPANQQLHSASKLSNSIHSSTNNNSSFSNASTTAVKSEFSTPALDRLIEVDFMSKLYKFMKDRNTAITRLPYIGIKQLNVFELFTRVQQLGGYEIVNQKKLWKQLYEELTGKQTPTSQSQNALQNSTPGHNGLKKHYERLLLPYETFLLQEQKRILGIDKKPPVKSNKMVVNKSAKPSTAISQPQPPTTSSPAAPSSNQSPAQKQRPKNFSDPSPNKTETSEPSVSILQVPKMSAKNDPSDANDLSKRPEITITPIPRSLNSITTGQSPLTSLQFADLMNLNLGSNLGVLALQDLAKFAEQYDKAGLGIDPPPNKKRRSEDGSASRVNGVGYKNSSEDTHVGSNNKRSRSPGYSMPDLLSSADLFRHMSALESSSKLLQPAHQSTKTMNALNSLLPQTSIYPAPAPAAHQQYPKVAPKPQVNATKPEPVLQSLSAYSQTKTIYGKPTMSSQSQKTKQDKKERCSSPEIEILDLRVANENKKYNNIKKSKHNDRQVDMELLDLSSRKDITVSAVPKPSSSRNPNAGKIPTPQVTIRATDNGKNGKSPLLPPSNATSSLLQNHLFGNASSNSAAATSSLMAALCAPGGPASLAGMGMANPALNYFMNAGMKNPPQGAAAPPMFPYLDPAALASYYSLLNPAMLGNPGQPGGAPPPPGNSAAAAAQLAQLSTLSMAGLPGLSPEAMANLGIYKNYLPQGSMSATHFLSGLLSPGNHGAPTSK